ncbi:hypothetical protein [Amycolatopsis suaedae]|uniref:Uncharacterized protein n=1 Tax=Amycolatopsis suaedae TaxID=2510978 RepID=A0A4Q7J7C5_9PSEU|nr:hypothetical protein [Amycolatopsis suaedae]RZQ62692.1 hypothetical protein EWH70_17170 [Amycolatopsis suaedae]
MALRYITRCDGGNGMPSSSTLPRPEEWPSTRVGRVTAGLAFVLVLAVLAIPVGFGFVAAGIPGGLRYSLVFSAMLFFVAAYGYVTQLAPRRRNPDRVIALRNNNEPATEIRGSALIILLVFGTVSCLAVFFGMAAVDYFQAGPDVPAKQIPAGLCAVAALYFGSFPLLVLAGRIRPGHVVLTPNGIYQRGWTFSSQLSWEALAGGKASAYRGAPYVLAIAYANAHWERRSHTPVWKIDKLPPKPMIAINCAAFAIDRNLLYHLVMFYLNNPSARAELGTERSIERARSGDPR